MPKRTNQWKTCTEAAQIIGCSVATVSRIAKKCRLGAKYGSHCVLSDAEIKQIRENISETHYRRPKSVKS